jgi:hypothetical protein
LIRKKFLGSKLITMYSRCLDVKSCLIPAVSLAGDYQFEPGCVFADLPPAWLQRSNELSVLISDGVSSTEMKFEVFISKSYSIRDGKIRVGSMGFNLTSLSLALQWKVIFEDLSGITESVVD